MTEPTTISHIPVLLNETLNLVIDSNTQSVFDGTLGLGGHAEAILEQFDNVKNYYGNDLDPQHLSFAQNRLKKHADRLSFSQGSFDQISNVIPSGTPRPLAILLDLGLCSNHIDQAEKGFSFASDGPLKMSFAGENAAEELLNNATESELTTIFRDYGEIRHAKQLAKKINETRQHKSIKTTQEFRGIIESVTHPKDRKKTVMLAFQAVRIAVNDELNTLTDTIEAACNLMQSQDRLGIISYHSLEDRIVKQKFAEKSKPITTPTPQSLHTVVKEADFILKTKKPVPPSTEEIQTNPRARSARLRILEKK